MVQITTATIETTTNDRTLPSNRGIVMNLELWVQISTSSVHPWMQIIQGESYVPVRQTEAVVRLLIRLLLFFLYLLKFNAFQLGKT